MDSREFRKQAHVLADRMADYFEEVSKYPVKSQVKPGEILSVLPLSAPQTGESFENIMSDFERIIMPGVTHWQSPSFFAFFPANSSYPSVLAEMLTAALGQQGMIWETSPAATELEQRVMEWLRDMCGLPGFWTGVIQDTASASTLTALLSAREKSSSFRINNEGFAPSDRLRVYCSSETHSSIEKAVKIAGFGKNNLVKVAVDENFAMIPALLEMAVKSDLQNGFTPCAVVASIGTTGSTAADPIAEIGKICEHYKIWLHVDAAFAGTAFLLPEMRHFAAGLEYADSYVFNPHKWMFTNFDASAYFVRDPELLIQTFEILPEYLKTRTRGQVNDYRDWGVALGRRFRALKLWFVIRSFGIEGLSEKIRQHIAFAGWLKEKIIEHPDFEPMAPVNFSLVCFRLKPDGLTDKDDIDKLNSSLLQKLNESGKLYLTHTRLNGAFVLRIVTAQTYTTREHVEKAWDIILQTSTEISGQVSG